MPTVTELNRKKCGFIYNSDPGLEWRNSKMRWEQVEQLVRLIMYYGREEGKPHRKMTFSPAGGPME